DRGVGKAKPLISGPVPPMLNDPARIYFLLRVFRKVHPALASPTGSPVLSRIKPSYFSAAFPRAFSLQNPRKIARPSTTRKSTSPALSFDKRSGAYIIGTTADTPNMFKPKTERIKQLAERFPERIRELEVIFDKKTNVYIVYANVRPWATKLGWHVDPKRLKQFLDSFNTISSIKFYQGTLTSDAESKQFARDIK